MNLLLDSPIDEAPRPVSPAGTPVSPLAALRYKWTIVLVSVAVMALGIPAIWLLLTPSFSATATIQIRPIIPVVLEPVADFNGRVEMYSDFLNTQVGRILDSSVLNRVLDSKEVQASAWYKEDSKLRPLTRLRRGTLSVRQRPHTQLIDVSATTKAPADAALIANETVKAYMDVVGTGVGDKRRTMVELLQAAESDLARKLRSRKMDIDAILNREGLASPRDTLTSIEFELRELKSQQRSARMAKRAAERVLSVAARAKGAAGGPTPASTRPSGAADVRSTAGGTATQPAIATAAASTQPTGPAGSTTSQPALADRVLLRDSRWVELNERVEDLEFTIEQKKEKLGPANPVLLALEAQLEHARRQRDRRATTAQSLAANQGMGLPGQGVPVAAGVPVTDPLVVARNEVTTHGNWVELYQEEVLSLESERDRVRKVVEELDAAQQEYTTTKREYDKVTSKLKRLEVEAQTPGNISRLGEALVPQVPTRDRRLLLTVMVIAGGLMAGFGTAYLRVMMDPSVRDAGQMQALVRSPFLGVLPEVANGAVGDVTDVRFSEQMRIVRTALMERLRPDGERVLLITSAGSGEGKTTLAIHLANSLARLGQRVLLMDADFRKGDLGARLDRHRESGLQQVLEGDRAAADAIVATEIAGVDLLPAGTAGGGSGRETLANGVFSAHLEQLKQQYDMIVIDGPPVLAMADAQILAGKVNGVLMTVRASQCHRREARAACDQLEMVGGRIIGVVLNGVSEKGAYGYEYGYEYGNAQASAPPKLTARPPSDAT